MAAQSGLTTLAGANWASRLVAALGLILVTQGIYQELVAMRTNSKQSWVVAATAFARHGFATSSSSSSSSVDLSWHAPASTNINDLKTALGGSGTNGFVYNNSYPTDVEYGAYNWCNMPHVRRQEYVKPSEEYSLKYVELIHRHHKRTVYAANAFPVESYRWDCDSQGLFFYGEPFDGNNSAHTYWTKYASSINPYTPSGFQGSCQFPQITSGGLDDSWQHGKDLYGVYHDLLHFLPDDSFNSVTFRVTHNQITSQVAGMVINGMFNTQEDIPLLIQPKEVDSLEPAYRCPTSAALYTTIQSSAPWTDHLTSSAALFASLDDISGVDPHDPGFHVSWDHYYDNLSARQCHDKPLPCKLVNGVNSSICVTQDMANEVYRLGNWEYSYIHRDAPQSLHAAVGGYGIWIAELVGNIRQHIAEKSPVIYRHNLAHDGSVSRLLSFLQLDVMVWPGMGSEVVFEVWQKSGSGSASASATAGSSSNDESSPSGYYLRVLWGGIPLRSSSPALGVMDLIPLERFYAYVDGLVGVDGSLLKGKCEGEVPY